MLSLTVPALNSRPGAAQTLYLDFDGSAPFSWFNATGSYVVRGPNSIRIVTGAVQAFSIDGDFNNFSAAELDTINHIWQWVAEKFSPFTINVTTVDPGFVSDGLTMTCLIAGSKKTGIRQPPAEFPRSTVSMMAARTPVLSSLPTPSTMGSRGPTRTLSR